MSNPGTTHENIIHDEDIKTASDRSFGIVFTIVFTIVGLWPLIHRGDPSLWALGIAGILLIVSIAQPVWLAPANRLWMRLGLLLHKITNPVIMGLVFFLTVTPTGIIMRAMGKDPLNRKIDRAAKSYWIKREPPGPPPETMINQF